MSDIAISFAILGLVVVAFISNRIPVGIVAIGAALALYFTGVLDANQALAGFGDPAVIFIATLFVVSEGLDASGVTAWAGQELIGRVGDSRTRLLVLMVLLVAGLTALISVNGAVAALLPVVVVLAVRLDRSPSQLLIPLVFGAHAGSMLALTGTPVNVIDQRGRRSTTACRPSASSSSLSSACRSSSARSSSSWCSASGCSRPGSPRGIPSDFSRHAQTLVDQYRLADAPEASLDRTSGLAEVVIPPRSGLVGETVYPGHGHRQRRPGRAGGPAPGRGPGTAARRRWPSATPCCCRGRGRRSTRTSTTRTCSSSTRPTWCAGRCRSG